MNQRRLQALDAFRGLAAIAVVLYHTILRYPTFMLGLPPPDTRLFPGFSQREAGVVPVLWFFLLSGFVLTGTIDRCRTPADVIVSRVSRIYPAYWASIALAVAIPALWPLPGVSHTPGQVLANLTMLQSLALIPDVAGVYWSLAVEVLFYVYALALFAAGLWRLVHVAAFAWTCLGLGVALLESAGIPTSWRIDQLLLVHFVPFLMAGMALYHLWRRKHRSWAAATLALCAATIALSQGPASAALCLVAVALIAAAAEGHLRWLAIRPLLWLGAISYSLYLVHEYPSYIVIRALDHAGIPHPAAIAAAVLASLMLATIVTYAVERPAMRLLRSRWHAASP